VVAGAFIFEMIANGLNQIGANPYVYRFCGAQQSAGAPPTSASGPVHAVKITLLSTMLTDALGVGEWGFSALVEADGQRVLFDTGGRTETVLNNAHELGIDLSNVEDVVLSNNHWDHVTGLVTLRRELSKINPAALSRAHVGQGIFLEPINPTRRERFGQNDHGGSQEGLRSTRWQIH
jgi:glyoxylase-like metal-dependent hydrolase (beta-lactamase superfamily II)